MATKKDEIKKKVAEKREEKKAAKKSSTKKQTKKVTKVTEEQLPIIAEEVNEPTVVETVDLEKNKDEKCEYDLTKATEIEAKTEVVNGDPAVIKPIDDGELIDETIDKVIDNVIDEPIKEVENVEKKTNKIIKKISRSFGYLWNGQAIDF